MHEKSDNAFSGVSAHIYGFNIGAPMEWAPFQKFAKNSCTWIACPSKLRKISHCDFFLFYSNNKAVLEDQGALANKPRNAVNRLLIFVMFCRLLIRRLIILVVLSFDLWKEYSTERISDSRSIPEIRHLGSKKKQQQKKKKQNKKTGALDSW